MSDFHEDDEDPQDIRAAFDRGPHGFTSGARDLAVRSGAFTSDYGPPALTRTDFLADQFCWAVVGSRPSWMSPDQYDPCNCRLPKGHDPVDGPGTLGGHCCGAHDDDHPAAIARFGGAS